MLKLFSLHKFNSKGSVRIGFGVKTIILLSAFLNCAEPAHSQIPTTNLVAYYPFTGNPKDVSGLNDGINVGATLTYDRFGVSSCAYSFDGSTSYINLGSTSNLKLNFPVSLSVWVNPQSSYTSSVIFSNDLMGGGSTFNGIILSVDGTGKISIGYGNGGAAGTASRHYFTSSSSISLNCWTHVVALWNSSSDLDLYFNGILQDGSFDDGTATTIGYTTNDSNIGKTAGSTSNYFRGVLDDIRLYSRTLSFIEIVSLYQENEWAMQPVVSSFTPILGSVGASVSIDGVNFSTTASNNTVYFGAVKATVTAAIATSLTVTVPSGSTYQPITVTTSKGVGCSTIPFNVTFPSVQSIDAASFAANVDYTSGTDPKRVAVGDINQDGKPDIVCLNYSSNNISVFKNTTTAALSFAAKYDYSASAYMSDIAVCDIDGDGLLDIVYSNESNISVLRNKSSGSGTIDGSTFESKVEFSTGFYNNMLAVGDVDGDGRLDVVSSNAGNNSISILRNVGSSGSVTTSSFASAVTIPTSNSPLGIALGDIDGDGKPDIAVTSTTGDRISIHRNVSNPGVISTTTFEGRVDYSCGARPENITFADLDGNGKLDMVVSCINNNTVSVFRNISSAGSFTSNTFDAKVDLTTFANPEGIAISDVDGDGKPDIAILNQGYNKISIFKNKCSSGVISSSTFYSKVDIPSGSASNQSNIVFGDLNGDSRPDLVVANVSNTSVSVLKNSIALASAPTITSFTPSSGPVGTSVTISGSNFLVNQGASTVKFGSTDAVATSWSNTEIVATVPALTAGSYTISVTTVGGTGSSSTQYVFIPPPSITSFSPSSGGYNSHVTINGANFGALQGNGYVKVGSTYASIVSWSDTQVVISVPSLLEGAYTIYVTTDAGTASSTNQFTFILLPTISYFNPLSGVVGSSVIVVGTNFGADKQSSTIKFGTVDASTTSWTDTQINATVPSLAPGSYSITVSTSKGSIISASQFAVVVAPLITSFTPTSGEPGDLVTINGENFGSTQGTGVVNFGYEHASIISWSDNQIVAAVPAIGAGNVTISVVTGGGTANSATQFLATPPCVKSTIKKKGRINILICNTANAVSYQWYLNNAEIADAKKQFYVARSNYGDYSVQVLESNGCNERSDAVTVSASSKVSVSPNPSDTRFVVNLNFEETGVVTLEFVNSRGVGSRILNINKDTESMAVPVDVQGFEPGVYILNVEVDGEVSESQKVIIQ